MTYVAILVITFLNLLKFFNLGGGIILGEPDEVTHAEIVANFSKSFWPGFSGGPWYYSLPLYPRLAHLISSFFTGQFTALRIISCFFSLVLALAIFFYVRWRCSLANLSADSSTSEVSEDLTSEVSKKGLIAGFAAALFWTLCPFAVYYSRVGVIEMTVTAFCFLFLFSFDYALETRRKKWALLSGLFLVMALLTKYTALIFVFVVGIYFVILSLRQTLKSVEDRHPELDSGSWRSVFSRFRNKFGMTKEFKTIKLDIIPTISLSITAAVLFPIAFIFYRHDPYLFKVHTMVNLISWEKFTGARVWVGENHLPPPIWPFVERMGWWLSWPILILAMIGVVSPLAKERGIRSRVVGFFRSGIGDRILISFLVACFFILRRLPFYPRYFLPLVPCIVIFAGVGFEKVFVILRELCDRRISLSPKGILRPPNRRAQDDGEKITKYQANKIAIPILLFALCFLILPTSINAYKSTTHNLIESTGQYIRSQTKEENPWIFSNYWPHFFGKTANTEKATWLAESKDEIQAFIPDEERTASEILEEEGGFVVLEELYSKALISPNKHRQEARQWLLENYESVHTIPDPSPNFPHSKLKENRVEVFVVK